MPDYKKELIDYRLNVAKEKVHSAEILLRDEAYKDSVVRSYYAMFSAVRALWAKEDANEQYERAEKFIKAIEEYLEKVI